MLRSQIRIRKRIGVILDVASIVAAFLLAFRISHAHETPYDILDCAWIAVIVLPLWYGLSVQFELYRSLTNHSRRDTAARVLKVHVVGTIAASAMLFLFDPRGESRALFYWFVAASAMLIAVQKLALREYFLRRKVPAGRARQLLVVGNGEKAEKFIRLVNAHENWGIRIAGILRFEEKDAHGSFLGVEVLGRVPDLVEICLQYPVDEVIFCPEKNSFPLIDSAVESLEKMGIKGRIVLDSPGSCIEGKGLGVFHGELPVKTLCNTPFSEDRLFVKRCLDILGAVVGLMILAIFFPFVALLIKMESRGPVLFSQDRIGENGRRFRCWKFRTMQENAEGQKKDLQSLNEMSGGMFKLRNDPRVTRFGKLIRQTSLDEWPQFWNVLIGEMSLVGPRPLPVGDVGNYEQWQRRRLSVKPGITGLWQVNGRSKVYNFNEVVRMDIAYIDNWTLWVDLKILFRTLFTMFSGHGAY